MYEVYCDSLLLYHDNLQNMKIFNPSVELELNKTGSFQFTIYPDHPYFDMIRKLKSIITVYQDDFLLFRGRVLNDEIGFNNQKTIICEGDLSFLLDSIQRPFQFTGTISEFLLQVITRHNSQVDAARQFRVGSVTIEGTLDINAEEYATTLETVQKRLLEASGGYIRTRQTGGVNHIDYMSTFNVLSPQTITFGKNLLDLKRTRKGEDIYTALIPLGAKLVDAQGQETGARLTVASVNGGSDVIFNQEAVTAYGWIRKVNIWDDVTSASELLQKGQAYLSGTVNLMESIELSAADLATVDASVESFHIGTQVQVKSVPHAIDQRFLVSKLSINLLDPAANKLTLGKTISTFTESAIGIKGESGRQGIKGDPGSPGSPGRDGQDGVGVSSIIEEFYLSTSKTTPSGGSWTTTAPTWIPGRYMWIRSKITYTSGTVIYTTPLCDSSWEAVNEIDVGGRNLIFNSDFSKDQTANWRVFGNTTLDMDNGFMKVVETASSGGAYARYGKGFQSGEPYIISFTAYAEAEGVLSYNYIMSSSGNQSLGSTNHVRITTEPHRYVMKYTPNRDFPANSTVMIGGIIGTWYFKDMKVEHGNMVTDWTMAPEDVEADIGLNVNSVDVWFYLSTSSTALQGGTWTTEAPAWQNGRYFWQKTITTLANGTTTESEPVCITGAKITAVQSLTAPSDTSLMWLDLSVDPPLLKEYNGTEWIVVNDVTQVVYNLEQNLESDISQSEKNITATVAEKYYLKDQTESLVSSVRTEFTQTKDSFEMQFTQFNADLEAVAAGTDAEFDEIRKYIRFVNGKILLGEVGNELELQIANDRISFLQDGAEVAYFSDRKLFVTDGQFINSLQLGDFAFMPRSNGNLSFKKLTAASTSNLTGMAIVGLAVTG